MKRQGHSPEQIIRKLRTVDQFLNQGQSVADVCLSPGGFRCHLSPLRGAPAVLRPLLRPQGESGHGGDIPTTKKLPASQGV